MLTQPENKIKQTNKQTNIQKKTNKQIKTKVREFQPKMGMKKENSWNTCPWKK